jgi:esterase
LSHVSDLKEAVRQLGLKNIIVIGHSQGGNEAVTYAAEDQDRVSALIAEDGGYLLPGSTRAARRQAEANAGTASPRGPRNEFDTWKEVLASIITKDPSFKAIEAENRFKKTAEGKFIGRSDPSAGPIGEADSMMQPGAAEPYATRVKCPTMVIRGANDTSSPMEGALTLASLMPDTRLVVIVPDGPHGLHREKPAEFLAAVHGFLSLLTPAK